MRYTVDKWSIKRLKQIYDAGDLNLNPPYQRNDIWLKKTKRKLIDSIERGFPLPAFFLLQTDGGKFDMVDGQQRTRAILGYERGLFPNLDGKKISEDSRESFLSYEIVSVIITEIAEGESIHEFYDRVNSLGLHLKRGETLRARYHNTKMLDLVEELADSDEFESLELLSDRALDRMDDIEFASELVTILKYGITEKKKATDRLFNEDISDGDYSSLKREFTQIISQFLKLNKMTPLKETRYRQRNDFYTFFCFLKEHSTLHKDTLSHFYRVLVWIGSSITPSNEDCVPLQEYAFACVSQSNSEDARRKRLRFFEELLLNPSPEPNDTQRQILEYFGNSGTPLAKLENYYTLELPETIN